MRIEYIDIKYLGNIVLPEEFIESLPDKIALFTTIQFIDSLNKIEAQLESKGKEVLIIKTKHTLREGQILGCNIERFEEDFDCFLYVGDGIFHPKALVMKNNKKVYCYNPFSRKSFEITEKDIIVLRKKTKAALLKFYSSRDIGVLITTKPGQLQLDTALKLKDRFPDKNFYFLVFGTIDFSSLEDFNFIEMFINTACPRLGLDDMSKINKLIINIEEIE